MIRRLKAALLIICCLPILLTGCWDYREVEELTIVTGIALDVKDEEKIMLTAEVITMKGGGRQAAVGVEYYSLECETIHDPLHDLGTITGQMGMLSQMQVVIVSQEFAKKHMSLLMDLFARSQEARWTANILVSREKTAKEIFETNKSGEKVLSNIIFDQVKNNMSLGITTKSDAYIFLNETAFTGLNPTLAAISVSNHGELKAPKLDGGALFSGDKFKCLISQETEKDIVLLTGKSTMSTVIVPDPAQDKEFLVLDLEKTNTNIKPVWKDNKLSMEIEVSAEYTIENHTISNKYGTPEGIKALTDFSQVFLAQKLTETILHLQKDIGVDVVHFGNTIRLKQPDKWEKLRTNWHRTFRAVPFSVTCRLSCIGTGMGPNAKGAFPK